MVEAQNFTLDMSILVMYLHLNQGDKAMDSGIVLNEFVIQSNYYFHFQANTYLPTPSAWVRYDTRSIFKWSLTVLNSEFSYSWTSCLTKAEEPSLLYYLPIAGGRIIRFIPFPRVSVLCEMQSVLSSIWTRVAVSISYEDNHYTTGTSRQIPLWKVWIPLSCQLWVK